MSFSKAKRFDSKVSDINGSPADYNLRVDPDISFHFGTSPRFENTVTKEEPSVECSRANCCGKLKMTCSTPKISNKQRQRNTVESEIGRSSDLPYSSESDGVISSQNRKYCQENINEEDKEVLLDVREIGNPPIPSGSLTRQNIFKNNYQSSAHSRKLNTIDTKKKIQFNEVNNRNQIEVQENERGESNGHITISTKIIQENINEEDKEVLLDELEIGNPPLPSVSLTGQNTFENNYQSSAHSRKLNTIDTKRKIQFNEVNNRNKIEVQENKRGESNGHITISTEIIQENINEEDKEVLLDVREIGNPPLPSVSLTGQNTFKNNYQSSAHSRKLNTIDTKRKIQFNEVNNRNQIEVQENERGESNGHKTISTKIIQDDQIGKHGGKMMKIKKVTTFFVPENSVMLIPSDQIANVISSAMINLKDEIQNRRRSDLNETNKKIQHLISEIYTRDICFKKEIKRLIDSTSANLIKQVTDSLNSTDDRVKCVPSVDINTELEEVEQPHESRDVSFNYENVFRVLTEQLQSSKDELEAIEQHLSATLDAQMRLDYQESIINFIRNEITSLRQNINE